MIRAIAFLVVLTLTTGALAPAAAHQSVQQSSAGETCPMMAHRVATTPCIGEPCPCDHSSDSSLLPDGGRIGVPEQTTAIAAPVTPWASTSPSDASCAVGFASPLDHPPDFSL